MGLPDKASLAKPWKFWQTVIVSIGGYANSILIGVVVAVIGIAFFGDTITKNLTFNLVFLAISDLAFLLIIAMFLLTRGYKLHQAFKLHLPERKKLWLYLVPALLGYLSLTAIIILILGLVFPQIDLEQSQSIVFKDAKGVLEVATSAIALLVVAPIAEELVFRGFIFKGLKNSFGFIIAAVVSSVIFGVAHGQINVAVDTFCLGIFLCYLYEKTDSIWPAIMLHMTKNAIAFSLIFIFT